MSKSKQKRSTYYTPLVEVLAEKYGVTTKFVYLSISKERHSERALQIERDYRNRMKSVDLTIG